MAYAELLTKYYGGEKIPCLLYSQKWKQREEGVKEFTKGMRDAFK